MNIEQYQKQKAAKEKELEAVRKELEDLENTYIEANKEYDLGDRVLVEDWRRSKGQRIDFKQECEVVGYFTGYRDEVKYQLKKVKKDGTISEVYFGGKRWGVDLDRIVGKKEQSND